MKLKNLLTPGVAIFLIAAFCLATVAGVIVKGIDLFFKPSYTRDQIPQAIVEICRRDYKLDQPIDVKIVGKTLGARITIENLFGPPERKEDRKKALRILNRIIRVCGFDFNSTSSTSWIKLHQPAIEEGLNLRGDLEEYLPELKGPFVITEQAKPIVREFSQAIRRVCMSTDATLEFCIIILRDLDLKLEKVTTFYIEDLVKASSGWVSGIDFGYFRNLSGGRLDNKSAGDKIVKKSLLVLALKEKNLAWLNMNIKSTPVAPNQRLYYLKSNTTSDTYQAIDAIFLLVNTDIDEPGIEGMYSSDELPSHLQKYDDISKWKEDELFIEDVALQEFFTEQISQIISLILSTLINDIYKAHTILYPDKEINLDVPKIDVEAKLLTKTEFNPNAKLQDPSSNTMELSLKIDSKDELTLNKFLNLSLWVTKNRCNTYKLFDFSHLKILDGNKKVILTLDKPELFNESPTISGKPLLFQR